jgi:hypothetical protein
MLPIIPLNSMPATSRGVRSTTIHCAASWRSCARRPSHSASETLVFFQLAVPTPARGNAAARGGGR